MKEISFFLASSISEFKCERQEFGDFIGKLNNILCFQEELYIRWRTPEGESDSLTVERKQEQYNIIIKNSEMFFTLIGNEAGKYTIEEYDVALETYQTSTNKKPQICVFFYNLKREDERTVSVKGFWEKVHNADYCFYISSVRELKLFLLLEIVNNYLSSDELELQDKDLLLDHQKILKIEEDDFSIIKHYIPSIITR